MKPRPGPGDELKRHNPEYVSGHEDCKHFFAPPKELQISWRSGRKHALCHGIAAVSGPRQHKIRPSGGRQFGFSLPARKERRSHRAAHGNTRPLVPRRCGLAAVTWPRRSASARRIGCPPRCRCRRYSRARGRHGQILARRVRNSPNSSTVVLAPGPRHNFLPRVSF